MSENESKKEEFTASGIFGQLPKEKWDELTLAAENQVVAARTIIFGQGDPRDRVYLIRSGKVRIFRTDGDGLQTDLAVLGPGESFGQMTLLTGEVSSTSAEAIGETHLVVLSKEQFEGILKDFPDISLAFTKQVLESLRGAGKIIQKKTEQEHRAPRTSWLHFLLLIGVSVMLALVFNRANPNGVPLFPQLPDRKAIPEITAIQAMEEVKKRRAFIVDARPYSFYEKRHIQGAISIPLSLFDIEHITTLKGEGMEKKVIVYGGTVSKLYDWDIAKRLLLAGHKDVRVLEGGMAAWEKKGFPMEEEKGQQ